MQLVAVAHPLGVEVHPNEGLVPEPRPFKLYYSRSSRSRRSAATDERGRDVLDRIRAHRSQYPDGFALERVRGYAAEHTLTLTLPPPGLPDDGVLLLTGWTDYAFSGDNVAAHQAGLQLLPPSLEVKGPDGRWPTAIDDIGMPVGRPQTVAVDLEPRRFLRPRARSGSGPRCGSTGTRSWSIRPTARRRTRSTRLDPVTADLRWRGFSAETTPDGREPYGYDYARVSARSPWKLLPGRYTREGDVGALLLRTDDMFVVSRPGDEIALSFDAAALPPLPDGWTRTFLLYADGYSKEMNLNSASPDALAATAVPRHDAVSVRAPEAYPSTPAHREYLERYNTRVVPRAFRLWMRTSTARPRSSRFASES